MSVYLIHVPLWLTQMANWVVSACGVPERGFALLHTYIFPPSWRPGRGGAFTSPDILKTAKTVVVNTRAASIADVLLLIPLLS